MVRVEGPLVGPLAAHTFRCVGQPERPAILKQR